MSVGHSTAARQCLSVGYLKEHIEKVSVYTTKVSSVGSIIDTVMIGE